MKKVCKICYRELDENQMASDDMCQTCKDIIGKGNGYKSIISEEKTEKWLDGWDKRKNKLKKQSKA